MFCERGLTDAYRFSRHSYSAFGSPYNEMTRTRLAIIVAIKLCISIR